MLYVVVHRDWGSFYVPAEVAIVIGCDRYDNSNDVRCNPIFIDWVKNHPDGTLKLACVPDEATDFMVIDYDGMESVIMCRNGRLEYADIEKG